MYQFYSRNRSCGFGLIYTKAAGPLGYGISLFDGTLQPKVFEDEVGEALLRSRDWIFGPVVAKEDPDKSASKALENSECQASVEDKEQLAMSAAQRVCTFPELPKALN